MKTDVRLLTYAELTDKGYKPNIYGELVDENEWVVIETQEYPYLGQEAVIVGTNISKDGKTYYTLSMNDGMEIEYVLDDCVEFLPHETKEEKIVFEECDMISETQSVGSESDVAELMYKLVDFAEQSGFEINVCCSLKKNGRRFNLNYEKEVE